MPQIPRQESEPDPAPRRAETTHDKVDIALPSVALDVVNITLRRMPRQLQVLAGNVRVHLEDYASKEVVEQGFEEDILGLFVGEAVGTELVCENPFPAQIILYIGSIWDFCAHDMDAFKAEVRLTYLHELGHFFGWDEEQVAAHGLE